MLLSDSVRNEFSFLNTKRIYLNNSAISPLPDSVLAAVNRSLNNRITSQIDRFETDEQTIESTRQKIAELIGAKSADQICYTANTTDSINILANGFDFSNGNGVLLHPSEFPSNVYPWLNQKKRGVNVRFLPENNGRLSVDLIEKHLRPETAVLAISSVQFISGYRASLKEITRLCHENNTLIFVDGIQSVGQLKMDVSDSGIDALSCGSHKWMMGPQGIGLLYLSEALLDRLGNSKPGWLSPADPWDFFNLNQPMKTCARRFESGTFNLPGIYGLGASVDFHLKYGTKNIETHILTLSNLIKNGMKQRGFSVFSDETEKHQSGISTFYVPESIKSMNLDIVQLAADRNLHISERNGMIRLSPHCYNKIEEIETALDILEEILNHYAV